MLYQGKTPSPVNLIIKENVLRMTKENISIGNGEYSMRMNCYHNTALRISCINCSIS